MGASMRTTVNGLSMSLKRKSTTITTSSAEKIEATSMASSLAGDVKRGEAALLPGAVPGSFSV